MSFLSLTIALNRDTADAFGDALMAAGALSVSVEDADEGTSDERAIFGEPGATGGLWDRCELTVLFAENIDGVEILWQVAAQFDMPTLNFTKSIIDDIDWVKQNQAQFPPIHISPRITIVPTWHEATNDSANAINIVLDPGAAFGTGSHPTTRLCLQWLEENVIADNHVLDYGTGSGILAIAAMKLGASNAMGVDIDSAAVDAARANAIQNNVTITFDTTDKRLNYLADITVANILANPLKVLAPLLASHTKQGGKLVLAGILDEQADDIIEIYRPYFAMQVWRQSEGWSAIDGIRQ
jgi:ribosomal protein L11 methyltransferase